LLSTLANRQDQPVTLTTDEAAGVEMTREWRDRAKDFESQNMTDGAVQFTWPAEIPSIVCAVLQVTDVALEPGEAITSVSTGDNLRWSVEAVVSGEGGSSQPHLIIKPFDRGLVTSVVVTTTRRSYHLTLRSTDQQYLPAVFFSCVGDGAGDASAAAEASAAGPDVGGVQTAEGAGLGRDPGGAGGSATAKRAINNARKRNW
jgi:hypothetical protein